MHTLPKYARTDEALALLARVVDAEPASIDHTDRPHEYRGADFKRLTQLHSEAAAATFKTGATALRMQLCDEQRPEQVFDYVLNAKGLLESLGFTVTRANAAKAAA